MLTNVPDAMNFMEVVEFYCHYKIVTNLKCLRSYNGKWKHFLWHRWILLYFLKSATYTLLDTRRLSHWNLFNRWQMQCTSHCERIRFYSYHFTRDIVFRSFSLILILLLSWQQNGECKIFLIKFSPFDFPFDADAHTWKFSIVNHFCSVALERQTLFIWFQWQIDGVCMLDAVCAQFSLFLITFVHFSFIPTFVFSLWHVHSLLLHAINNKRNWRHLHSNTITIFVGINLLTFVCSLDILHVSKSNGFKAIDFIATCNKCCIP